MRRPDPHHISYPLTLDEWAATVGEAGIEELSAPGRPARAWSVWVALIRRPAVAIAALLTIVALTGGVTAATLTDTSQASAVATLGGQLNPPATYAMSSIGGVLRTSWTPPAAGLTSPQFYEIWRSTTTPVVTTGAPTASPAASPYDATLPQCTTYSMRMRSAYAQMRSVLTPEISWLHDGTAPTVARSAVVATSGPVTIADWVKPSGTYEVYAQVDDNCAASSALSVAYGLTSLGGAASAPATFGSYTPVAGGPTYNFKAGPFTTSAGLTNAQVLAWSITSTDPAANHLNSATTAGAPVTVDATVPVSVTLPRVVSDLTNYYAPDLGIGEVAQNTKYRVYAEFTDTGTGVSPAANGVIANTSNLTTGATAVSVPANTNATGTENGVISWNRFNLAGAGPTANGIIAEGVYGFSVTARDAVGNSTVVGDTTAGSVAKVEVDNTKLTLSTCGATNGNGALAANDTNVLTFNDTLDPESIATGWTGTAALTALRFTIHNGELLSGGLQDFITWNDSAGVPLNLLAGSTVPTNSFNLTDIGWIPLLNANITFASSTITRNSRTQHTFTFAGSPSILPKPALSTNTGTMNMHPTRVTDAAGNNLSAASAPCSVVY